MMGLLFGAKARNRRYSYRKKTRNLVLVSIPTEKNMMNLVDISEYGVQFSSTRPLRKNKMIDLKINLAEQDRQISVTGRVVWTKMVAGKNKFCRVGVAFVELSQEAWTTLHNYLALLKAKAA